MGYERLTKNGYDMFTMSSMIQKAIRRCDIPHAAYAANELSVKYRAYLWRRLLTVSAEDCYGIMTKEIVALQQADEIVNKNSKPGATNDLFIAKAVVLLCMARKNRDADYVACNFMWNDEPLTDAEFEEFVDYKQVAQLQMDRGQLVPDYVYDVHTRQGRARGKNKLDMFRDENEALQPRQMSLFDNGSYGGWYDHYDREDGLAEKTKKQFPDFARGKETDPTHNGTVWPPDMTDKK